MRSGLAIVWLGVVLTAVGCAGSRPVVSNRTASTDYNSYNEDLASVRPVYNPISTSAAAPVSTSASSAEMPRRTEPRRPMSPVADMHINRHLDLVLDTIANQNRSVRYAPGFRIQVYVGNQRQQVDAVKLTIAQNFPELSPYLSYTQPTYKLKVGDFMRRIDAERYFSSIRQLISSAQLQADKVDVRRSLSIKWNITD